MVLIYQFSYILTVCVVRLNSLYMAFTSKYDPIEKKQMSVMFYV